MAACVCESSRASMLKKRFAVTIFKAKTQLQQQKSESDMATRTIRIRYGGEESKTIIMAQEKQSAMDILAKKRCREREAQEKQQRMIMAQEEKHRMIMAQQEKQQRMIVAQEKQRRDIVAKRRCREREARRKMEKSVDIYDDHVALLKGLKEITSSSSTANGLFYGTDYFCDGKRARNLERLGLFLKEDLDLDDYDDDLKRQRKSEREAVQLMEIYDDDHLLKYLETLSGSQASYDLFFRQRMTTY